MRLLVALLALSLAFPAHAVEQVVCAPEDRECILALAGHKLVAALAKEEARSERLGKVLAACRETQEACPVVPEQASSYPWRDVALFGTAGVVVGFIAALFMTRAE